MQNITTQLRGLTETLCSCTLDNDTFIQANVTCPSNNEPWTAGVITVLVQYASDDGLVTASDLVGMIQSWLLDSSCGCIAIGGSTLQLSRGCCINGSSSQVSTVHSGACLNTSYLPKEGLSSAHIAAGTISGFVGGVLLTICIGACVIIR